MDQSSENQSPVQVTNETVTTTPVAPVQANERNQGSFDKIRHITAWVMIVSAITFALIGILAVWEVFGPNTGDVVWRAFSSLAIIAFAALIVNVAARLAENKA